MCMCVRKEYVNEILHCTMLFCKIVYGINISTYLKDLILDL